MLGKSVKSHVLVTLQLVGVTLSCWPVGLVNRGSLWWLVIVLAGTLLGLLTLAFNRIGNFSIYPEPRAHARLITNGPYRFMRHPMYTSLIIMMAGIAAYNGHWLNLPGVVAVLLAVYGKAGMEETFMRQKFPDYQDYATRTPRFIPGLRKGFVKPD